MATLAGMNGMVTSTVFPSVRPRGSRNGFVSRAAGPKSIEQNTLHLGITPCHTPLELPAGTSRRVQRERL